MRMLSADYDKKHDILYIDIDDPSQSIGCEQYDGVVVMRNHNSRALTGLLIYNFAERLKKNQLPKPPSEFPYSYVKDIIPLIHEELEP